MIAFFTSCLCYVIWNLSMRLFDAYGINWIHYFNPVYVIIPTIMYFAMKKMLGWQNNKKLILLYLLGCVIVFLFTFVLCYFVYYQSASCEVIFLIYYPAILLINIVFFYIAGFKISTKKIGLSLLLLLFILPYPFLFIIWQGGFDILDITMWFFLAPILLIETGYVPAGLVFFELMLIKIYAVNNK